MLQINIADASEQLYCQQKLKITSSNSIKVKTECSPSVLEHILKCSEMRSNVLKYFTELWNLVPQYSFQQINVS